MSQIRMDMIWQHEQVLPYLLGELKDNIEAITPIRKIYLFGSRAKIPFNEWNKLEGKDWDICVVCDFEIVNTQIWTKEKNYYLDLVITDPEGEKSFLEYHTGNLEIYPENQPTL